ncbi:MAG: GNAT family N-acetyltransferase [Alicyclobacillus sp.]|nr:GNAT family N-acetyltransferase [Alicyclobacillus sp.]
MEIKIRTMVKEDYDAVINIISEYNKEHGEIAKSEFYECFFGANEEKQTFHVAVTEEGKVVGVMGYKPDRQGAEGVYWAVWLYIHPTYRRLGIATKLWRSIEEALVKLGGRKCYLDVGNEHDQPEAVAFHKRQGFTVEGIMKDYWRDGEDMMLFGKRLKPKKEICQDSMRTKIVDLNTLAEIAKQLRNEGKTIALCHGCFDLFHIGHLRHFKEAKRLANILFVTVTPDRFVNKGEGRPVFTETLRAEIISALECVDYVAINQWPSAVPTLKLLIPNYFVKGPDYHRDRRDETVNPNIIAEEETCATFGIHVHYTNDITSSSTQLINKYLFKM